MENVNNNIMSRPIKEQSTSSSDNTTLEVLFQKLPTRPKIDGLKKDTCSHNIFTKNLDGHLEELTNHGHNTLEMELQKTQFQLSQVEIENTLLKKKLKEADCNVKRLQNELVASDKNARDMRAALTTEVADKHDQVVVLRRELAQLEEQLRQADMQTHFKDDIIKGLRKEVKVARSKETLVEVLGIKNRQLCHQELLDQKELEIADLKAQLSQFQEAGVCCTESVSQHTQNKTVEKFTKSILEIAEEIRGTNLELYNSF